LKPEDNGVLTIYPIIKDWDIFSFFRIMEFIRKKEHVFINIHYVPHMYAWNGVTFSLPLFYAWLKIKRKKVFTFCHETVMVCALKYWRWFPFAIFNRIILTALIFLSVRIAFSTGEKAQGILRIFPWQRKKIMHIPVFSNFEEVEKTEAKKETIKKQYKIDKAEIVLFFMGGLHISKLIDYVLAALDHLVATGREAKLICAGFQTDKIAGYLQPNQRHIISKIVSTGLVSKNTLEQLLGVADIYLCPYKKGISTRRTSALAGLSAGIPVVSTFGQETDQLFMAENRDCLLLCKDKKEFIKEVERLAKNTNLRKAIGQNGKRFYNNNFGVKKAAKTYLEKFLI